MAATSLPEALHRVVEEYVALGDHRTGTSVDAATRDWFAERCRPDLDVRRVPYTFDRYQHRSRVVAGTTEIEHLPLYYQSIGAVGAEAEVVHLACVANFAVAGLDDALDDARRRGVEALVVVEETPHGRLVALNRTPVTGDGPATVLVGADAAGALVGAPVRVQLEASLVPTTSETIVATAGDQGPEIVVTTPLSGWFRCGGERGPGIALALDLARHLAARAQVTLIATTGHELGHAGPRAFFAAEGRALEPDAVIHLGASIATGPPTTGFPGCRVQTHLPAAVEEELEPVFVETPWAGPPSAWVSEAKEWLDRTELILSLSGSFERFHTPDDDASSTSPARLAAARAELHAATDVLLRHLAEA